MHVAISRTNSCKELQTKTGKLIQMSCLGNLAILEISMKMALLILQYFDTTTIL